MAPQSDHFRFEQVADRAWAAIATDGRAAVGNAAFAGLGAGSLAARWSFAEGFRQNIEALRAREAA